MNERKIDARRKRRNKSAIRYNGTSRAEKVKVKIIRKIHEKEWILRIKYLRIEERIISRETHCSGKHN